MATIVSIDEFCNSAGRELEPSDWFEVTQQRIDRFADATEDHQFIHIDPERAAETPFGGTVAHGFLTLSLLVHLNAQHALVPEGLAMVINYGSDKVRFLAPVPAGGRIRSRQKILEVTARAPNTWLVRNAITVEIEHAPKPALIAELLMMFVVE
jgi:acyl dehydratase